MPVDRLHQLKCILLYYWKANTIYNVHSEFIAEFINEVMNTSKQYYAFYYLESLVKKMKSDHRKINFHDFGAGATTFQKTGERKISEIAKTSVSDRHKCRMLFNLANHYQVNTILELGTSLGISAIYMHSARKNARLLTIEGDETTAELAAHHFRISDATTIELINGEFSAVLPTVLKDVDKINLLFLDGNHTYEATIKYFQMIKPYLSQFAILVLDDIYWSEGMTKAWNEIKSEPTFPCTIEVYGMGICFAGVKMEKQHFDLISYHKKPWRIGVFA
jgi:predicted O-methyltransferase YrrM